MIRLFIASILLVAGAVSAGPSQLSETSVLKADNHILKVELYQRDLAALDARKQALVKERTELEQAFRLELRANETDQFDWTTHQFIPEKEK